MEGGLGRGITFKMQINKITNKSKKIASKHNTYTKISQIQSLYTTKNENSTTELELEEQLAVFHLS